MSALARNQSSSAPETPKGDSTHSYKSKSDSSYANRLALLKASQSISESSTMEISKLNENSNKMLEIIDQMVNREENNEKYNFSQNQLIQEFKQKLSLLAQQGITNEGSNNVTSFLEQESEQTQLYFTLLDELRKKQDEIDILSSKSNQMNKNLQELENFQKSQQLSSQDKQGQDTIGIRLVSQQERFVDSQGIISKKQQQNEEFSISQIPQNLQILQEQLSLHTQSLKELNGVNEDITYQVCSLQQVTNEMKQQVNLIVETIPENQNKPEIQCESETTPQEEVKFKQMEETLISLESQIHQLNQQQIEKLRARESQNLEKESCSLQSKVQSHKPLSSCILQFLRELFLLLAVGFLFYCIKEFILKK